MNPQLKEAGLLKKLFLKFSYWKIFKAIKLKEAGLLKEFFFLNFHIGKFSKSGPM